MSHSQLVLFFLCLSVHVTFGIRMRAVEPDEAQLKEEDEMQIKLNDEASDSDMNSSLDADSEDSETPSSEASDSAMNLSLDADSEDPATTSLEPDIDYGKLRFMKRSKIWRLVEGMEDELKGLEGDIKSQTREYEEEREKVREEWAAIKAKFDGLRKAYRTRKKHIDAMVVRAQAKKRSLSKVKRIGYGSWKMGRRRSSSPSIDSEEPKSPTSPVAEAEAANASVSPPETGEAPFAATEYEPEPEASLDWDKIRQMKRSEVWKIVEGKEEDLHKLQSFIKARETINNKERSDVRQEWAAVKAKFDKRREAYRADTKKIETIAKRVKVRKGEIRKLKGIASPTLYRKR